MVQSYGDFLYKEIKMRSLIDLFKDKSNISENIRTLDNLLIEMNITKSTIYDIEISFSGAILHLKYILQSNKNINFGLCDDFKMWENKKGWQYGCRFDKGKGKRIQVYCYGNFKKCEREEEYNKTSELKNV